ncbi:MAG: hypothetical protein CL847_06440 [Crocinitomicaceae bacterium]|nr:hypothetical protein [Crocinitomicaceae bacterium]|tara:strand:+ start:2452 stop:2958 length:507 start_codon:yes stop_codon:yes gene_type:complete
MSAQKENCFEFIYPLTFEVSDGSTLKVDNHRAMIKYKSSWKQNTESPNLKFPIKVKWTGKDPMIVESQEILDRHMDRCKKYQVAQKENCFEFIYPLAFELSDGSTLEVDNHRAMIKYKSSWKQNAEFPNLKFPIKVKWTEKDPMVVESQEMLDRHIDRCIKYQATRNE